MNKGSSKAKEELKKEFEEHLKEVEYTIENTSNSVIKELMINHKKWLLEKFKVKYDL